MSTLSGLTSKGEKGKSKFQSLDINNLYKVCRGESSEKQQQKSSLQLKHGMQSLGKVPSARRAPVNLPSIKSEHSGNDTAVSLVPSGGAGWGNKESNTITTTSAVTTAVNSTNVNVTVSSTNSQASSAHHHPPPGNLPVANLPQQATNNKHVSPTIIIPGAVATVSTDKSWSAVMSGPDLSHHPPPYQSPQFQHEFPSLSAGDGAQQRTGTDVQYGPGPSLRPQTEGSWMQGGSRGPPAVDGHAKGNNLAPQVVPPQLSAPVGLPSGQPIPQYPVFAPPFMCRGNNFVANGHGGNATVPGGNVPPAAATATSGAATVAVNGRGARVDHNRPNRSTDTVVVDELAHRPIIKEEDLNRMDDMRDMGWAANDDIDYNQKIAFSDDENEREFKREKHMMKEVDKSEMPAEGGEQKIWSITRSASGSQDVRNRMRSDDEEIAQRRKQHNAEVALVVSRAKQRKEEEEKRYQETKMMAQKKLQELEEKMKKRVKENDEGQGTINPMSVPPQSITPSSTIPVPDWEKDKDYKSEKPESVEEKPNKNNREASDFRQMTQIETTRSYPRKDNNNGGGGGRSFERERESREQNGSSYAKFQNNLPPRFQKQQLRNNNNSNAGPQTPPSFHPNDGSRWMQNNQNANKQSSPPMPVRKSRDLDSRRTDDYGGRGSHRNNYQDASYKTDNRQKDDDNNDNYRPYDTYDYNKRDEEKWEREKVDKQESFDDNSHQSRSQTSDEFHEKRDKYMREDKMPDRYERPQRPDSRDSRASRDSRHSRESVNRTDAESKEYFSSWTADTHLESSFEENKRKDMAKEDRRQVPGPITKDRIEAEDLKSERRNLTQLKRGLAEKKPENKQDEKKEDDGWDLKKIKESNADGGKSWNNSGGMESTMNDNKFADGKVENCNEDSDKKSEKLAYDIKEKDEKRGQTSRMRSDNRNQGWSGGTVYRSSWASKRGPMRGGSRSGGLPKSSNKNAEWHGTDSDISADELSQSTESVKDDKGKQQQRSPKPMRKFDKDEKNKDKLLERKIDKPMDNRKDYLPRGEPSRHGRGGGNFRGRGGGGMSKRIDHYGPPSSKSPFSNADDKEKKSCEEVNDDAIGANRWKENVNQSSMKSEQKIDGNFDKSRGRKLSDNRRGKSKSKDGKSEDNDTTSENSDESASKDGKSRKPAKLSPPSSRMSSTQSRRNPPPRLSINEKRNYLGRNDMPPGKPNNSTSTNRLQGVKKDDNSICNAIADISLKGKDVEDAEVVEGDMEEKSLQGDSDGFQEVKSKKNGKERLKIDEKPITKTINPSIINKVDKEVKIDRKSKPAPPQMLQQQQQQISNIPPVMPQSSNKSARISKLPPRFVKQRENNRLQKQQLQHTICDMNDINKVNQTMTMYAVKDNSNATLSTPISNAWEKPLSSQLRNNGIEQESLLTIGIDNCKGMEQAQSPSQINNSEKVMTKSNQDKAVLDGTSPPVTTIIFENTNFKSAPGSCVQRNSKTRANKMEDGCVDSSVMSNFNKPITDVLNKNEKQSSETMMQINFTKEDGADMKLDFIESEISYLTEDKTSKNVGLPRSSMHAITSSNTTISPSTADALNMKIASVKKVWESMPTVVEHAVVGQDDSSFTSSFGTDPNGLDPSSAFAKSNDAPDDNHEVYSPSPNNQAPSNNTTNVCKVKPTQQVAGSVGQTVLNTSVHQSHSSSMVGGPGLMSHPLSPPPPMQPVIGAGVGLGQRPQQFTANQHIGYQAGLGGSTQYGVPAIPSPPTVLFNSSQQLQAQTAAGLYGTFQIDQTQVLGGQGRSQYSQYPNPYNLGQTASSPYSAQSMYLQTAQPHPQTAQAPPDIYQNMNSYRIPATAQFGQNQQLNNPSTVLISSTSNSLMSATVKPSSQQISAIGTKASGVGQTYQQQSQTGQQLYMAYDPSLQANFLPSTGVMQRGPAGPVQNNVVPALQASSSFYSGSTGGQTGYFQQPGSSTLQSAGPMQQHQTGYGLQGNVFGTHNQTHTNAGMQNFSSHFLSAPMQLAAAAAISAQQYHSPNMQNAAAFMKGVGSQQQQINDQSGRSQQLKSPSGGGQQEVLSSVFNSDLKCCQPQSLQFLLSTGQQIPSPKSRQACKQPPPQPSPTAQHKYNLYQNVGNQQCNQSQRYPTPIQRPVNYQSGLNSVQNNGGNPKHRSNQNNRPPQRQYYSSQGNSLSNQSDKADESKMNENVSTNGSNTTNSSAANLGKSGIGNNAQSNVNQSSDINKDKEETSVIKD